MRGHRDGGGGGWSVHTYVLRMICPAEFFGIGKIVKRDFLENRVGVGVMEWGGGGGRDDAWNAVS